MTQAELKQAILGFLTTTSLSEHEKNMIEILLPAMSDAELNDVYMPLRDENEKMTQLNEKQKRIELKYKMMVDGLTKARGDK